ncbi:MAG: type IX secretion system outer membrane channel protein PorV [Flavobacteriales bacterium]|nr:type IX secretion system outer membrane channel protein PorV [Flavobacteriales bacterium]
MRMSIWKKFGLLALTASTALTTANAQTFDTGDGDDGDLQLNTITTAVPFLMIGPDTRAGGMGDVGAATTPDGASIHWNPGKLAFAENKMGFSLSYTPWLKALVPDINLAYLSGYGKIGKKGLQTLGGSLRFFSLGDITFTDQNGQTIGQFNPNEFAIDLAYSRVLAKGFSGGLALRYVYSNLTGGINVGGADTKPGMAFAADLGFYYQNSTVKVLKKKTVISAGLVFSNIGSKMSYTNLNEEDFIPMNLRLGVGFKMHFDDYNSLGVYLDVNKLLVPTPPQYLNKVDSEVDSTDINGDRIISAGQDPNVSVPAGLFQSFGDAPGGTAEEVKEVQVSTGLEYWYSLKGKQLLAIRAGYFHEDQLKGNRQYATIGIGIRYNVFGLDFSYLIPVSQRHPLENTFRFTLIFDFEAFKKQNKGEGEGAE